MEWRERWEWLSGVVLVVFGWFARRRVHGANGLGRSIADLLNAKRQLEICEAERAYLRETLEQILRLTAQQHQSQPDHHHDSQKPP